MTLIISPALDALAPLLLPPDLRLTPEQFELVCAENREAVLEPQEASRGSLASKWRPAAAGAAPGAGAHAGIPGAIAPAARDLGGLTRAALKRTGGKQSADPGQAA